MHQDVYPPGISESAACFGMPQVVLSGSPCMNYVCCAKYALIFLVYVYIVS
jgi:hypothetical protein